MLLLFVFSLPTFSPVAGFGTGHVCFLCMYVVVFFLNTPTGFSDATDNIASDNSDCYGREKLWRWNPLTRNVHAHLFLRLPETIRKKLRRDTINTTQCRVFLTWRYKRPSSPESIDQVFRSRFVLIGWVRCKVLAFTTSCCSNNGDSLCKGRFELLKEVHLRLSSKVHNTIQKVSEVL